MRRMMRPWAWLLCALAAAGCSPESERTAGERPVRIVLITLDTLRLDSFDGPRSTMPETLAWASTGRIFDAYYSVTSTTQPTHATLFTGLYPWEHGLTANAMILGQRHETVAEVLAARGFETAAVVASFPLHGDFGFDQGFQVYVNEFGEDGRAPAQPEPDSPGDPALPVDPEDAQDALDAERDGELHSKADRIQARVDRLLDEIPERDQFLWFHYFDPHAPYGDSSESPERAEARTVGDSIDFPRTIFRRLRKGADLGKTLERVRARYDTDVLFMDGILGDLFQRLDDERDRYETHVVVLSDHGEALGEGGTIGHGKRLLDCLVRVPLFIVSPRVEPGRTDVPVGTVDVAATLLALAGEGSSARRGRDLTGALDAAEPVHGMRRTFEGPYEESRTDNRPHLLPEHLFFTVRDRAYYTGDPGEVRVGDSDIRLSNEATAAEVRDLFGAFLDELRQLEAEGVEDPEVLRRLEALGYTK